MGTHMEHYIEHHMEHHVEHQMENQMVHHMEPQMEDQMENQLQNELDNEMEVATLFWVWGLDQASRCRISLRGSQDLLYVGLSYPCLWRELRS